MNESGNTHLLAHEQHDDMRAMKAFAAEENGTAFLFAEKGGDEKKISRARKLLVAMEWLLVHQGTLCFIAINIAIFGSGYLGAPPTTEMGTFVRNPLEAWPKENAMAFSIMFFFVIALVWGGYYLAEPHLPAKKKRVKNWWHFLSSICFISTLGFLALWLAAQVTIHEYGLTHEVWGLVFGMVFCNLYKDKQSMPAWMGVAARGEDFIKVGLVLLGLDIATVMDLAAPAILTSWPITFVVIWFAYFMVAEKLGTENNAPSGGFSKSLAMMLAVGLAVCGSSAATAIHGAIPEDQAPHRDEELGLVIAILNAFTVVQMVLWPYVAYYVGLPLEVSSAWFGGTIDGMGNVVAAGSIYDELYKGGQSPSMNATFGEGTPATDIASTVKIIQIMLICPVTVCVTIYWMLYVEENTRRKSCKEWVVELYDRFPKFVIGFLFYAIVLTIIKENVGELEGKKLEEIVIAVRTWWFTIGFVGVGMCTHINTMTRQLKGGKTLVLYCAGQGFDLLITLGAAYLFFNLVFADQVADFIEAEDSL